MKSPRARPPPPPVPPLAPMPALVFPSADSYAIAPPSPFNGSLPPLSPRAPISSRYPSNSHHDSHPPRPLALLSTQRTFHHHSAPFDRDYAPAQVDPWPLTSCPGAFYPSPTKDSSSLSSAGKSPLSPRARKSHARHKLLDDSKTRPLVLQELYAFLHTELQALPPPPQEEEGEPVDRLDNDEDRDPQLVPNGHLNLQRLQVFRQLFHRVIASFSVYAPLLAQIQDEYEAAISALIHKAQLVPQLHAELQSLETQCLHEISKNQLETAQRHRKLKLTLKETQAKLTACAAQNAHLLDDQKKLLDALQKVKHRKDEMLVSNHTLVSGMKRQDETLRHIHDRSREEGMALQQMTWKYHRACEEIAELKITVATLEEKVGGGVHVAADKATIALLARELQEMHGKVATLQAQLESLTVTGAGAGGESPVVQMLVRILDANGAGMKPEELLEMIRSQATPSAMAPGSLSRVSSAVSVPPPVASSPSRRPLPSGTTSQATLPPSRQGISSPLAGLAPADVAFGVDRTVALANEKIASFHRHHHQWAHRMQQQPHHHSPSSTAKTTTFVTEPPEEILLESTATSSTATASPPPSYESLANALLATSDFIATKGNDPSVPEYLQSHGGVVRNLYYDRRRVELLIAKVWAHKDDLEGNTTKTRTSGRPLPPQSLSYSHSGQSSVSLSRAFFLYLQRCFPSSHHAVECAYNVIEALERFASASSDCRLFLLVLRGQLPEQARQDQANELYTLHDALFAIHREKKNEASASSSGSSSSAHSSSMVGGGGGLPLGEVVQALRRVFPWKSESQLSGLHRALLCDQRGHLAVDYAALLVVHDDSHNLNHSQSQKKLRVKSQFCECLRAQYIDDLVSYRVHLQHHVQQAIGAVAAAATGSGGDAVIPKAEEPTTSTGSSSTMLSIKLLREYLQRGDPAKPVQDINKLLSIATELSMNQILTQDSLVVSVAQFLGRLPTLLLKPSGKFLTPPTTAAGPSTAVIVGDTVHSSTSSGAEDINTSSNTSA